MPKKKQPKNKQKPADSMSSGEIPRQRSKKKKTTFTSLPALSLPGKKIHPRQVIPPVAKGKKVQDITPSLPLDPDCPDPSPD